MISESASLILPFHQEMDEIREDAAGKSKIGTTRRGIGPCYEDKVGRRSIRVMDLISESNLDKRLENVFVEEVRIAIKKQYPRLIKIKTMKKVDFQKFRKVLLMMERNEHLTLTGLDAIRKIRRQKSLISQDRVQPQ